MQLNQLKLVQAPLPLNQLNKDQLKELQTALSYLGYPVGKIDGLIGPRTRTAWAEYKTDVFEGNPLMIGPQSIEKLIEKVDLSRHAYDFTTKDGTIKAIAQECLAQDLKLKPQVAYILATVEWETAKTFKPVKEAFWHSESWRQKNLVYFPYYGRGFVQLTWKDNYQYYSKLLGIDMVVNPDLAMDSTTAVFILVHGFKTGSFTGRKLSDYINQDKIDFIGARRCINGTDHDHDIAKLAQNYVDALNDQLSEATPVTLESDHEV